MGTGSRRPNPVLLNQVTFIINSNLIILVVLLNQAACLTNLSNIYHKQSLFLKSALLQELSCPSHVFSRVVNPDPESRKKVGVGLIPIPNVFRDWTSGIFGIFFRIGPGKKFVKQQKKIKNATKIHFFSTLLFLAIKNISNRAIFALKREQKGTFYA